MPKQARIDAHEYFSLLTHSEAVADLRNTLAWKFNTVSFGKDLKHLKTFDIIPTASTTGIYDRRYRN
jgi:hypothetical protein